jgi:hypothetical protein
MPDDPSRRSDPAQPSSPDRDKTACGRLASAKSLLERVLGRRGEEHWGTADYDSCHVEEVTALEAWARESGCWLTSDEWLHWDSSLGMGEHHLHKRGDRVYKATKKVRFGVYPSCSGRATGDPVDQLKLTRGTPHQYLMRLELLNRWSESLPGMTKGPMNQMEGCAGIDGGFSIITSQPWFPHDAVQTTVEDIAAWMARNDFQMITAGIWYHRGRNLALFDVKPSNMIRSGGHIIPIDVIPIEPFGRMKTILEAVLS